MSDATMEQQVIDLATAHVVVLGAVCHALAKAGAIQPGAFMDHLAAVRAEWLARSSGVAGVSEGQMADLMMYLEIQADFPKPSSTAAS